MWQRETSTQGEIVWFMACPTVHFFLNRWYIRLCNSYRLVRIISCFSKIKLKTSSVTVLVTRHYLSICLHENCLHVSHPFRLYLYCISTCMGCSICFANGPWRGMWMDFLKMLSVRNTERKPEIFWLLTNKR